MKQLFLFFFLFLPLRICAQGQFCSAADLKELDQAVEQKESYDQAKLKEIARCKQNIGLCITPLDKYHYYEQLYQEYQKWNPDSARHYAQACKKVALENNLTDLYEVACINEAYIHVICGDMLIASDCIQKLHPIQDLPLHVQKKMAVLMLEFNMRAQLGGFAAPPSQTGEQGWRTYSRYLNQNDWRYLCYQEVLLKRGDLPKMLKVFHACKQPSFEAASLAVSISQLYYRKGDYGNYIHYLIRSAINDIQCSNREATSLLYLLLSPYVKLNIDQAFKYVMLCTENAKTFKDQGRSLDVVKAQANITKAYQHNLQLKSYILYAIIFLLAGALVVIYFLFKKIRQKSRQQAVLLQKLENSNLSLQEMIRKEKTAQDKLQDANVSLQKEINYHNQHFFDVYHLVSKYIEDVKEFKKMLFNLITVGKYDKARKELSGTNADKYLKTFFEHFDQAFLLSHPDFVNRFNALLRPECQITPSAPDILTPELRIYALVSIGITDSVSIAHFLHYSPQTVYNYRLKIRHSACIDEKDFATTVAKMYENQK